MLPTTSPATAGTAAATGPGRAARASATTSATGSSRVLTRHTPGQPGAICSLRPAPLCRAATPMRLGTADPGPADSTAAALGQHHDRLRLQRTGPGGTAQLGGLTLCRPEFEANLGCYNAVLARPIWSWRAGHAERWHITAGGPGCARGPGGQLQQQRCSAGELRLRPLRECSERWQRHQRAGHRGSGQTRRPAKSRWPPAGTTAASDASSAGTLYSRQSRAGWTPTSMPTAGPTPWSTSIPAVTVRYVKW